MFVRYQWRFAIHIRLVNLSARSHRPPSRVEGSGMRHMEWLRVHIHESRPRAANRFFGRYCRPSETISYRSLPGHHGRRSRRGRELENQYRRLPRIDRKSTRLNSVTNAHLVCRLLLEKKNIKNATNENHNY